MPTFNHRGRQVLVNEDVLRQLLSQAQMPGQGHAMVSQQETVQNEYTVFDEDTIREDELARYAGGGVELDMNRNRNDIPDATFGSVVVH